MTADVLYKHIECTPGVMGGKPRIAGRRISVQNIVTWHEHQGMTPDEISTEHNLTLGEVHAALSYYFDHREEIGRHIKEGESFVEELRNRSPSRDSYLWPGLQIRKEGQKGQGQVGKRVDPKNQKGKEGEKGRTTGGKKPRLDLCSPLKQA